ncbi:hypothetical protein HXZ77_06055 [Acinetobacter johnsonii]|uniref:hypothetical protein n=1 Tax=Acinetobacter johnsonii TaxID=40214 RepID=UPI0025753C4B|nr:hypothetical protein [Acinetobacter johnsonii]MDM1250693.1 hypothetical protein [Acinetobacter johnsonii]
MIDDDFDFDQPVTRIPQNPQATKLLGNRLLQQAEQYLASMGSQPHAQLVESLRQLELEDPYFAVMADQLEYESDEPIGNDVLNLLFFWQMANEKEANIAEFQLPNLIQTDYFQATLLDAYDAMDLGAFQAQRRRVIEETLKLYQQQCYAGCITVLYGQIEGILTDALIEHGYLQQNQTKFVDVYKIVPGLKGHEVKSLWHKVKIASEINPYFLSLEALKMDASSSVTSTRHNMVHGADVTHFTQARSFILFIWLFAVISFISTVKR